jgi:hypothetical protein
MRASNRLMLIITLTTACGGGGAAANENTTVANNEEATVQEPQEQVEATPDPTPTRRGPGRIHVVIRVGGHEASGHVRVLNDGGDVVAEGDSGETFNVDSGTYTVEGHITDRDVMFDTPTMEIDGGVTVEPGEEATANVDFNVSRVRIHVRRNNRDLRNWRLELTRQGTDQSIQLQPSNEHIPITPGRYDGTVIMGSDRITVEGIIFPGGATRDLPIDLQ